MQTSPKFDHFKSRKRNKVLLIYMEENMRKSQFTETQIVAVLKQHEQGFKAADLARLNAAKIHFKFFY